MDLNGSPTPSNQRDATPIPTPDASAIGLQVGHTEIYKSNGIIFAHLASLGVGPEMARTCKFLEDFGKWLFWMHIYDST